MADLRVEAALGGLDERAFRRRGKICGHGEDLYAVGDAQPRDVHGVRIQAGRTPSTGQAIVVVDATVETRNRQHPRPDG